MRNKSIACLCLLLALALPGWTDAVYQQRLAATDALLTRAAQSPAQATALLRQIGDTAVLCPELRAALDSPTAETLERARRALAILRRADALTPANSLPADSHAALQSVLSSEEFRSLRNTPNAQWRPAWWEWLRLAWSHFWKAVGQQWRRMVTWVKQFFPRTEMAPIRMPDWWRGLRNGLYLVLLAAILFAGGLLLNRALIWWQQRRANDALAHGEEGDITRHGKPEPTPWDRALHDAESLWERGETREALRTLLRACLLLLDARGLLRYEESRANGEVLRALRAQGLTEALAALTPIIRGFDRGWYGLLAVEREEFTRLLEHSRRLRTLIVREQ